MEQTILDAILGGSPWALLAVLLYAYYRKDKDYATLAESRVKDAQSVVNTLMEIAEENNNTTQGLAATLAAQTNALTLQTTALKELRDAIERLDSRRGIR